MPLNTGYERGGEDEAWEGGKGAIPNSSEIGGGGDKNRKWPTTREFCTTIIEKGGASQRKHEGEGASRKKRYPRTTKKDSLNLKRGERGASIPTNGRRRDSLQ